jgi:hypothetical protein
VHRHWQLERRLLQGLVLRLVQQVVQLVLEQQVLVELEALVQQALMVQEQLEARLVLELVEQRVFHQWKAL